jgi:periplasmic divalent cation tolerance protein
MKPLLVMTTVDSKTAADQLADHILGKKLAACVSVSPGWTSHYRWEGKRECSSEHLILIKTLSNHVDLLKADLLKMHPYDCPEIIVVEADAGNPAYWEWMLQQCPVSESEKSLNDERG